MRGINYNYTWFTGRDNRGLAPPTRIFFSPRSLSHSCAFKVFSASGRYRRLLSHIPDDPLYSKLLNKHVRTKSQRVACAVVLKAMLKAGNTSAFSHCINAPRWLAHCLRALCISNPPSAKRLDCATKFMRNTNWCSWASVAYTSFFSDTSSVRVLSYIQRANILKRVKNKKKWEQYLEFEHMLQSLTSVSLEIELFFFLEKFNFI